MRSPRDRAWMLDPTGRLDIGPPGAIGPSTEHALSHKADVGRRDGEPAWPARHSNSGRSVPRDMARRLPSGTLNEA